MDANAFDASDGNPNQAGFVHAGSDNAWFSDPNSTISYDSAAMSSSDQHIQSGSGEYIANTGFEEEDDDGDEYHEDPGTTGNSQSQYESIMLCESAVSSTDGNSAKPSIKLVVKRKHPQANNIEEPFGSKIRLDSPSASQSPTPKQEVEDNQREGNRQTAAARQLQIDEWKRLSSQLKMADRIGNTIRLCEVLRSCIKHEVSVELLKSNDTAKVVRTMAKKSFNPEVKKLSHQLVTKWKDVIEAAAEKNAPKDENGNSPSTMNPVNKKTATKRPMASLITEDLFAPSSSKITKRKERPKTAKVLPTKFRSTGLEGDEPTPSTSTAVQPKKKIDPVTPAKTVVSAPIPKKPMPPVAATNPKRAMLSTGFMDDLRGQVAQKKVVKVPQRPKINRPEIVPAPVMPGRVSHTSSGSPRNDEATARSMSPEAIEPGKRRVHFADDKGKDLVAVRYFEIQEGERVNMTRLTPDELKHFEMREERTHKNLIRSKDEDESVPVVPGTIPWRLLPVDVKEPLEVVCKSKAVQEEEQRQRLVMAVFVDPNVPMNINSEPDEEDQNRVLPELHSEPRIIPQEPVDDEENSMVYEEPSAVESVEQPTEPAKVTPDIQNIMNQLRQSSAVTSMLNQTSQPSSGGILPSNSVMNNIADIMNRVNKSTAEQQSISSGGDVLSPITISKPQLYTPQPIQSISSATVNSVPTIPTSAPQAASTSLYQPVQPNLYQPIAPLAPTLPKPPPTIYRPETQIPVIPSIPLQLRKPQFIVNSPQSPPRMESLAPAASSGIAILNNFDVHGGMDHSRPPGDDSYVDTYPSSGPDSYPPVNGPAPGGNIRQCTYFLKGQCHFGEKCLNGHGDIPTAGSKGVFSRGRGRGMAPRGRGAVNNGYGAPVSGEYESRRMRGRGGARSPPSRRYDRRFDRSGRRSRSRSPSFSPPRRGSSPDFRRRRERSPRRYGRRSPQRRDRDRSRSPRRSRSRSPRYDMDTPRSPNSANGASKSAHPPSSDPLHVIPT